MKKLFRYIIVGIVSVVALSASALAYWGINYRSALYFGAGHNYEKAINRLKFVPRWYKETDLHIWRFEDAILTGENASVITYEQDADGWLDTSAIMRRGLFGGGHDWSIDDIRQDFKSPDDIKQETISQVGGNQ